MPNNIIIIPINTDSIIKRILWDWFGIKRWLKKHHITANLGLSLQNTFMRLPRNCRQFIYLHQAIPLHPNTWSFFKKEERRLAFYKYIYPFFIFAKKDVTYIVQTEWMKQALCRRKTQARIIVTNPYDYLKDINIENANIDLNLQTKNFNYHIFYPASAYLFKNHREIIYALAEIKKEQQQNFSIGVLFTIEKNVCSTLFKLIKKLDLEQHIIFLGEISYDTVLTYYKYCNAVVFPSYIESFGLPLIEAIQFNKPIVTIDAEYAREVIGDYAKAVFAKKNSPEEWARLILKALAND